MTVPGETRYTLGRALPLDSIELLLILAGFAIGAYGSLVGVGGGLILVPALLLLYPDDSQEAITSVSLSVVLATASSSAIAYGRRRLIDYRTGTMFAAVAVPAAFAGAFAVRFIPKGAFEVAFGALLIGAAALIVFNLASGGRRIRSPLRGPGIVRRSIDRGGGTTSHYAFDARTGVGLTAGSGFVSALFGVGGGIFQVPVMVTQLRFPVDIAVATSQFMLIFMATSGISLHAIAGDFGSDELTRASLLAVGAIVGAQAGAALSQRIYGNLIIRLLAAGLILVGARLILTSLF